ncbi:MAG TPA: helix-turn-helix domain-containing protein, partial [Kofleriaceae bacterium]
MPGLRERKKQETRKRISDTATGLFMQRGFDKVTVAEIAELANVSKMTVFNYFARKEDMLFDREPEALELIRRAVVERPAGAIP